MGIGEYLQDNINDKIMEKLEPAAQAVGDFADVSSVLNSKALGQQITGFITPFQQMAGNIMGYADGYIFPLLVLHIVWTVAFAAISGRWVFKEIIQAISGALVALWLVRNSTALVKEVLGFFMGAGASIAQEGSGYANEPGKLIDLGVRAATPYLDSVSLMMEYELGALLLAPIILIYLLAVVVISLVYIILAAFILFALIEFYFAGAIFVLLSALVVHPVTRTFVQQAAGRVVNKGIGYMFIIALLGIAHTMLAPSNVSMNAQTAETTIRLATMGDLIVTFAKMTLTCVVLTGANKMLSSAGGFGFGLSSMALTGSTVQQVAKGAGQAAKSAYSGGGKASSAAQKAAGKAMAQMKALKNVMSS